jgi:hypothetical protein
VGCPADSWRGDRRRLAEQDIAHSRAGRNSGADPRTERGHPHPLPGCRSPRQRPPRLDPSPSPATALLARRSCRGSISRGGGGACARMEVAYGHVQLMEEAGNGMLRRRQRLHARSRTRRRSVYLQKVP